jgi:hypothetical protein
MVSRPDAESPYPIALAAHDPFVWVLSANTADVTRIDAGARRLAAITPIGVDRDTGQIAGGRDAAWVADGDGTLARVDAGTGAVTFQLIGRGLRDVAVAGDYVWVTNQLTRCCGQE